MSHVQRGGPLRAPLARVRRGPVSGRGAPHTCVLPLRSRVLGKDGARLESDPTAARNACLPRCLSFLWNVADWGTRPRQTHLPRARRLRGTAVVWKVR